MSKPTVEEFERELDVFKAATRTQAYAYWNKSPNFARDEGARAEASRAALISMLIRALETP